MFKVFDTFTFIKEAQEISLMLQADLASFSVEHVQDPRRSLQREQLLLVWNSLSVSHPRQDLHGSHLRFNSDTNHPKYKLQLVIQIFKRYSGTSATQ